MDSRLRMLQERHRELNRRIDTSRAAGWQKELAVLKRLRLRLKDRIAALARRGRPAG